MKGHLNSELNDSKETACENWGGGKVIDRDQPVQRPRDRMKHGFFQEQRISKELSARSHTL